MQDNRFNPSEEQDNRNEEQDTNERFESDTQKIIHRHLENEDDVITDEDIRNVRVGMSPPQPDTETMQDLADDNEDRSSEDDTNNRERISARNKEGRSDEQVTPWDTIDPES